MRALLVGLTLLAMTGPAMAVSPAPLPLLGRVIGGVGENGETLPGVSKRCFVYPNQAVIQTYDASTGKGDSYATPLNMTAAYIRQVSAVLVAAEKEKETGLPHNREANPHVYYFGYAVGSDGTPSARIRLFYDGARRIERQGRQTPNVIQLIENLCPHR